MFPSPNPQDPHLCPESPTRGWEASSDLLGASPRESSASLFSSSRPRTGVGGQESLGIGVLLEEGCWLLDLGSSKSTLGSSGGRPGSSSYLASAAAESLRSWGSRYPSLAPPPRRLAEPETSGLVLPSRPGRRETGVPGARLSVWGGGGGFLVTPGSGAIKAPLM